MRKCLKQKSRPQVVPMKKEELGRLVEVPDILLYADKGCRSCFGAGAYISLVRQPDGREQRVGNACGCARDRFLRWCRDDVGYDPNEKGVPVRWRKARETPAGDAPATAAARGEG